MDDFIAILRYKKTEEGGRSTPAKSGYRPQIKFSFEQKSTSGQQTFIDAEIANPSDTIEAAIKMLSPQFFHSKLDEGMEFVFTEGNRVIGTGVIKKIKNNQLKINQ